MQPVDVLGDDRAELARFFQLRELVVRGVGLFVEAEHLVAVEAVEFPGLFDKEGVAENLLGRIVVLLIIQSVHAAEVGDAAFGAHARSAEKHDAFAFVDDLLQLFYSCHIVHSFLVRY